MTYSKYDTELSYDENEWVVSLINTKKGLSSVYGGHAKIVIEGIKKNEKQFPELFIGEYHIMEAEKIPEETWIPQVFRNTQCKYLVLFKEGKKYDKEHEHYTEIQKRSCGGVAPLDVMKMIKAIKEEQRNINEGTVSHDFQYAGKWCAYGLAGAHNCTTWAEEKLGIIGLERHLIADSTKAAPFLHVNVPDISGCILF